MQSMICHNGEKRDAKYALANAQNLMVGSMNLNTNTAFQDKGISAASIDASLMSRSHADFTPVMATTRDLYLEMKFQLMALTGEFFEDLAEKEGPKSLKDGQPVMNFEILKQWLNLYPFIRLQVRESLNPRMWSMTSGYAVTPLQNEQWQNSLVKSHNNECSL